MTEIDKVTKKFMTTLNNLLDRYLYADEALEYKKEIKDLYQETIKVAYQSDKNQTDRINKSGVIGM